ncbi:type III-B CRISPR module-associated protein Cmr5 [Marinobacterium aestuarii]|uniref:CRISPR type III-B/RAMP module-associated protein Cmr5 n=1 Tax=Marinobacterium aestuarii TaxID=1821621 RepID=A0A1A9F4L7_9GAMM|nr:type III-B CRISPR module-associated protein Cmr5 [Marinobacterium aestuarii]
MSPRKSVETASRQQTIAQQRAGFALKKVLAVTPDKETANRFKAYANSLPAMIQTNGIGQALAFAKMKGNGRGPEASAWLALYKAVSEWLTTGERGIWPAQQDVMEAIVAGDQYQYQRAHAEAQALLSWIKQFARAEIAGDSHE